MWLITTNSIQRPPWLAGDAALWWRQEGQRWAAAETISVRQNLYFRPDEISDDVSWICECYFFVNLPFCLNFTSGGFIPVPEQKKTKTFYFTGNKIL